MHTHAPAAWRGQQQLPARARERRCPPSSRAGAGLRGALAPAAAAAAAAAALLLHAAPHAQAAATPAAHLPLAAATNTAGLRDLKQLNKERRLFGSEDPSAALVERFQVRGAALPCLLPPPPPARPPPFPSPPPPLACPTVASTQPAL